MTSLSHRSRAAPMHPDDRREALVEVFVDLARRHGRRPTTAEIAREAGVAGGTIFRAFPTKDALEAEAVLSAFCPAGTRRRIAAIDASGSLRDRLVAFTRIMQHCFIDVFGLMQALGLAAPPDRGPHLACLEAGRHLRADAGETRPHGPSSDAVQRAPSEAQSGTQQHTRHRCEPGSAHPSLLDTMHEHLVHDDDRLVVPARSLVHRLRLLTFSASHPDIADGEVLTPEEIVDTVLFGLAAQPDPTDPDRPPREAPPC